MPTILMINGWRFFFFMNEGNEPIHIHCELGDKSVKYWLDIENIDIREEKSFGITPRDKRLIKKAIFSNFDYIVEKWQEYIEANR